MYSVGMYPDGGDVGMTRLRDKSTGQYVSSKKSEEIDPNKVIDIWFGPEPSKETASDWPIDFTIKILGIIFLLLSIFYLLRRI